MMNKIFAALLSRRESGLQDYYEGMLRGRSAGTPNIDEARKDFRRMMHAQSPFTSL